ncbi:MAG: hypothetical protein KDA94_17305 [Acidimicrobiales bacterium]|nr:hypothetical protein [Acidimicrobiales bacterium]
MSENSQQASGESFEQVVKRRHRSLDDVARLVKLLDGLEDREIEICMARVADRWNNEKEHRLQLVGAVLTQYAKLRKAGVRKLSRWRRKELRARHDRYGLDYLSPLYIESQRQFMRDIEEWKKRVSLWKRLLGQGYPTMVRTDKYHGVLSFADYSASLVADFAIVDGISPSEITSELIQSAA